MKTVNNNSITSNLTQTTIPIQLSSELNRLKNEKTRLQKDLTAAKKILKKSSKQKIEKVSFKQFSI